ncbi:ATP-binding cassette domain-containing protein [Streptomyces sp. NPDC053048]|uniref:ATP-binding cassette domain-containing protein n=1 Tax=Streptomyces sp. NPDC053048 TaxID=3365694 RepID=UPI0037D07564
MRPSRLVPELIRLQAPLYCTVTLLWLLWRAGTFEVGLLLREFFDLLSQGSAESAGAAASTAWSLVAAVAAIEAARMTLQFGVILGRLEPRLEHRASASLRTAMMRGILSRPGAQVPCGSTGEALTTLSADVDDVSSFVSWSPVNIARWVFAVAAVLLMLRTDALVTVGMVVPLVLATAGGRAVNARFIAYRKANREATASAGGALRDTLAAVQTVQAARAEKNVAAHLSGLYRRRSAFAAREELFGSLRTMLLTNGGAVSTGLVLLLGARRIHGGGFTVGDLAMFCYYLQFLNEAVSTFGMFSAKYHRAVVATEHMARALGDVPALSAGHRPTDPPRPRHAETSPNLRKDTLRHLAAGGLTYRYPGSGRGITGVDLSLERGTLTVITGRVGSGKTTLLRVLLGLLPAEDGVVLWNGREVRDPAAFMVPPRCAYTPQSPRLFSGSIRANILLGLDPDAAGLGHALELTVLEPDLDALDDGLDTVLGAAGLGVSGGQLHRVAAARMLVRRPDLLVCDDLSSALDADTERLLWDRVLGPRPGPARTALVVTHRPALLRRADRILVLRDGAVAGCGPLPELLSSCPEMRRLWHRRNPDG